MSDKKRDAARQHAISRTLYVQELAREAERARRRARSSTYEVRVTLVDAGDELRVLVRQMRGEECVTQYTGPLDDALDLGRRVLTLVTAKGARAR